MDADRAAASPVAGKVVALTGGARGIGLETVRLLAGHGAKVGVGDIDLPLLEQSLTDVQGETAAFPLDVADRDSFASFVNDVEQRLGPIDVLINNAGVMSLSPLLEEPDAVGERMLRINLLGPMYGMKIMIPRMLERGRGHIVNIVSSAGRFGLAGAPMYTASKFGVFGLTESASAEYARTPLRFSAVCPVVVNTELSSGLTERARGARTLEPEDVARAIMRTIERPRAVVYVPSHVRFTYLLTVLLPERARRVVERLTRADRLLMRIDTDTRRAYDRRAFGADTPGDESGDERGPTGSTGRTGSTES